MNLVGGTFQVRGEEESHDGVDHSPIHLLQALESKMGRKQEREITWSVIILLLETD